MESQPEIPSTSHLPEAPATRTPGCVWGQICVRGLSCPRSIYLGPPAWVKSPQTCSIVLYTHVDTAAPHRLHTDIRTPMFIYTL